MRQTKAKNTIMANNVTRKIFRSLVYSPLRLNMMRKNFDTTFHINCNNYALGNDMLDLVTVACNNDYTIEQQYRLLNEYLADSFCYTVADNSSIPLKQQKILDTCRKSNIAYIRLPSNPLTMGSVSGYSHGMALNWLYYNYIKPRAALYFGFLDHDIYPVKRTGIKNVLEHQPMFGCRQPFDERDANINIWYLYPGFCFFRRDYVLGKVMDFTPNKGWDTGFSNWASIYSKMGSVTIEFPRVSFHELSDGKDSPSYRYEIIGDWIHAGQAVFWDPIRENLIAKLLEQY